VASVRRSCSHRIAFSRILIGHIGEDDIQHEATVALAAVSGGYAMFRVSGRRGLGCSIATGLAFAALGLLAAGCDKGDRPSASRDSPHANPSETAVSGQPDAPSGQKERVGACADTLLHIAAAEGDVDRVKRLLDEGADINARGQAGQSALHEAVAGGHKQVVQVLVARGADAAIEDDSGESPYYLASRVAGQHWKAGALGQMRLYRDIFQLLSNSESVRRKYGSFEEVNLPGFVFHTDAAAERFLAEGGSVTSRDSRRQTPLHTAASAGRLSQVRLFLEHGADVDARDNKGSTPLHCAAHGGRKEVVGLLLARGANVNAATQGGLTPLHWAVMGSAEEAIFASWERRQGADHAGVAKLLLQAGATVDARAGPGETPLHIATRGGLTDMAELLLAHGADINAVKNAGEESEAAAKQEREPRDRAESLGTSSPLLFSARTPEAAQQLLAQGADIDARDQMGRTPLHVAAANGEVELVKFLLNQGARVDAQERANDTPLHAAAENGRSGAAAALLSAGADPNARGRGWFTPLHKVAESRLLWERVGVDVREDDGFGRDYLETARVLLRNGANANLKAPKGKAALHMAAESGDEDLAELLVAHGADVNARRDTRATPLHDVSSFNPFGMMARGDETTGRGHYQGTAAVLVAGGADVNATMDGQYTPLHLAARYCDRGVAEVLVAHGADLGAKCHRGETPLAAAKRELRDAQSRASYMPADTVAEWTECFEEMIRWLTEQGAEE
jgi:ankyrin repeat protein